MAIQQITFLDRQNNSAKGATLDSQGIPATQRIDAEIINEIKTVVNSNADEVDAIDVRVTSIEGSGSSTATGITYDNTLSGLSATNVKLALDEVQASIDSNSSDITTLQTAPPNHTHVVADITDFTTGVVANETTTLLASGPSNGDFTYTNEDGVTSTLNASTLLNSAGLDAITFDNVTSGLSSTDLKGAIDELATSYGVIATGTNTSRILQDRFADAVNVRDFGAVGDGVTDDSAAFQSAINTGKLVNLNQDDTYLIANTITVSDQDVFIQGNNATIQLDQDINFLNCKVNIIDVLDIANIDNTTSLDQTNGDPNTVSNVTVLTVADSTGYLVGDIVKIVSDDLIVGETSNRKIGEYNVVAAVSSTTITLKTRILNTYTTNKRIGRVNPNKYRFNISGFLIKGQVSPLASWSKGAIDVIGYTYPVARDIHFEDLVERGIRIVSCYNPRGNNISAKNIRTSKINDAFGYIIHEVCSTGGLYNQISGIDVRHVYSNSAISAEPLDSLFDYGQTTYTVISNSYGENCQSAVFDTHADGEHITFIGCVAKNSYYGNVGSIIGFQLRGRYNKAVGCTAIGGNGFRAFADSANSDNCRDVSFVNCTYYFNPNETQDVRAFSTVGNTGFPIKGVVVNNPVIYQDNGSQPSFETFFGDLKIINPTIKSNFTGSSQARFFEINDNQSSIISRGGNIDISGATGTNCRIARFAGDGLIDIKDLEIIADGNSYLIGDLINNDGTLIVKNLDADTAPAFNTSGIISDGGNSTVLVDWKQDDARTDTYSNFSGGIPTTSTITIDIDYRYGEELYCRFLTNGTTPNGATINNITSGKFIGQKLNIRLLSSSSKELLIDNTGTNISAPKPITLEVNKPLDFVWDGSNWLHKHSFIEDPYNSVVIVKEASDFGFTVSGQIEPDGTKTYFIDGDIDLLGTELIVGPAGLTIYSDDFNNKTLTNVKFVTKTGSYAGNITIRLVNLVPPFGEDLFTLDNDSNSGSIEILNSNIGSFGLNRDFGTISNYRQLFMNGNAFFNYTTGFELIGTFTGITVRDCICLNAGSTSKLFSAGLGFNTDNFRCSINMSPATVDIDAVLADFAPTNINNDSSAEVRNTIAKFGSNILPNLPKTDVKSLFIDNIGLENTYTGGRVKVTTEATTTITTATTPVKGAGTTTYFDLTHFSDGGGDNSITYLSDQPKNFVITSFGTVEGGTNDNIRVILRQWDDSASAYVDIETENKTILNTGTSDIATFNIETFVTLEVNDRLELWLANDTDTTNLTLKDDTKLIIKNR